MLQQIYKKVYTKNKGMLSFVNSETFHEEEEK